MSAPEQLEDRRAEGEEGAVLLMAIGFVLLFALLAGSLLDATTVGLKETGLMHVQRGNIYTAEAGVQTAVRRIRNDFVTNITAAQDGTWDCASVLGATTVSAATSGVNSIGATVTCTSGTTSTFDTGGKPPNAIMTIGGGLTVDKRGSAVIGGSVSSGGSISVTNSNGKLDATGFTVRAVGSCTGKGTIVPSPTCKAGGSNADPGYSVPTASGSPGLPSCSSAVVTFSPGVYTSSVGLNALFTGAKNSTCTGKSFVFSPGVYVFDFTDGNEWKIADAKASIVAGAKGPWTTKPPIPGGCVFDNTSAGTTFVFKKGSRLNIDKGRFEMCAPSGGSQRIGIAGDATQSGKILRTGDKATVTIRGTVYAPKGDVDVRSAKSTVPVLSRGVVARSVKLQSDVYNVQVIQLPTDRAHAKTDATLQLQATIGGGVVLDAEVNLHHDASTGPTGTVTVTTTSWEVHA